MANLQFHRGMTPAGRQQFRADLEAAYVERARQQARAAYLTDRCRRATEFGEPQMHQPCRGEDEHGSGCLCTCHDASAGVQVISRKDEPR